MAPIKSAGFAKRPDFLHFIRCEEVDVYPNSFGNTGIVLVLVHPVRCAGKADVGDFLEADLLACFFLKAVVKFHRIFVNLAN